MQRDASSAATATMAATLGRAASLGERWEAGRFILLLVVILTDLVGLGRPAAFHLFPFPVAAGLPRRNDEGGTLFLEVFPSYPSFRLDQLDKDKSGSKQERFNSFECGERRASPSYVARPTVASYEEPLS